MSMILCLKETPDAKIEELLNDTDLIENFVDEAQDSGYLELDKAWHGIHFLLTNSDWKGEKPLCYLLHGGQPIGDIDVGYGPANAITSKQVADFDAALEKIDEVEFRSRFNPKLMMKNEIYPTIWDRPLEEDDTLGYLCHHFMALKDYVKTAKQANKGLIIWMS